MYRTREIASRIPRVFHGRPEKYRNFFEANYGEQPIDKFNSVRGLVKKGGKKNKPHFFMQGEVAGNRVLVAYANWHGNGSQELHAEIVAPDNSRWTGTLILENSSGIVIPSFTQNNADRNEEQHADIHPENPRLQGMAVFSMLNYIENIIPQIA